MTDESEVEDIGDVIDSYRRRRERLGNSIIYGLIALAMLAGVVLIYIWLSGENGIALPFISTSTFTPTATSTITPTFTPSNTPLPTLVTPSETPTSICPAEYTIQSGDTLTTIAQKCGLDGFLVILAANPAISAGIIHPGDKIKIPPPGTGVTPTAFPANLIPGVSIIQILVQPGDNLKIIADRCHTTVADVISQNGIKDQNKINAGDVLKCTYGKVTPAPIVLTATIGPSLTPSNTPTTAPTSTRAP
jgi:LysM repeat protein